MTGDIGKEVENYEIELATKDNEVFFIVFGLSLPSPEDTRRRFSVNT